MSASIVEQVPRSRKGAQGTHSSILAHAKNTSPVIDHSRSIERQINAGCDVFRAGDRGEAVYNLVEGWVALYNVLEDGRRQILQFALPGAVLAFISGRSGVMNYSAQALTKATVCIIAHENLVRLSRDDGEIGMQLASLIAQDRSLAFDHLASIGRRSARERVAHLLLELFIRSRMRWPGYRSEEIYLPLTQEHIADATGLTGVHVNRVLRALCKERIVEFHYRRLHILNPDELVEAAKIDPQVALSWINDHPSNEAREQATRRSNETLSRSHSSRRRSGKPRERVPGMLAYA